MLDCKGMLDGSMAEMDVLLAGGRNTSSHARKNIAENWAAFCILNVKINPSPCCFVLEILLRDSINDLRIWGNSHDLG